MPFRAGPARPARAGRRLGRCRDGRAPQLAPGTAFACFFSGASRRDASRYVGTAFTAQTSDANDTLTGMPSAVHGVSSSVPASGEISSRSLTSRKVVAADVPDDDAGHVRGRLDQRPAERPDQVVARGEAHGVVHLFETVDVQPGDHEHLAVADPPVHLTGDRVGAGQPGQRN